MAARPGILKSRRAAGKQTGGGVGGSPGETRFQGGKLAKAKRSPEAPGEVATVPRPTLGKRKVFTGTSQEATAPKRSQQTVEEDGSESDDSTTPTPSPGPTRKRHRSDLLDTWRSEQKQRKLSVRRSPVPKAPHSGN